MGKKRKKKPEINPKPKPDSVSGENYPKTLAELLEKLSITNKEKPQ